MAQSSAPYENNPLLVATKGIELLFAKAVSVAVLFMVLIGLGFFSNVPTTFVPADESKQNSMDPRAFEHQLQSLPAEAWVAIAVMVVFIILIAAFIKIVTVGVGDYTAAKLSKGEDVTLGQAFRGVFSHFWGYTWVLVIVGVKILLWSLLLIVPGIIMAVRYSLSGVSYFDKQLKGSAAVEHSLSLTKGAWLTTFASQALLPVITLGVLQYLTVPGTTAVLYRQYSAAGKTKPQAHVLSWLTLILPFALLSLVLIFGLLLGFVLASTSV